MWLNALLMLGFLNAATGYATGYMNCVNAPGHGTTGTSNGQYTLTVSDPTGTSVRQYRAGQNYTVTLASTGNTVFRGYIMAGFSVSATSAGGTTLVYPTNFTTSKIVGTMVSTAPEMTAMTGCRGGVTHTDGTVDKVRASGMWAAPTTFGSGAVVLWAEVVTTYSGLNYNVYSYPLTETTSPIGGTISSTQSLTPTTTPTLSQSGTPSTTMTYTSGNVPPGTNPSPSPTVTPDPTVTPSASVTPSQTPSATTSVTPSLSLGASPSSTPTSASTGSPTASVSPTSSVTPTVSPSSSLTPSANQTNTTGGGPAALSLGTTAAPLSPGGVAGVVIAVLAVVGLAGAAAAMTYSSKVKAKRNIQRKFAGSPVIMHNHPVFRSLAPVPPVPAAVPNLSINPIAAVAPVPPVAPVAPPAPPPPPSGPTTYQQYVTIDGKSYYTDGPGGAPLAEGWMRVCDGTDVWYAHHGGEVSWEAKYYGSSV